MALDCIYKFFKHNHITPEWTNHISMAWVNKSYSKEHCQNELFIHAEVLGTNTQYCKKKLWLVQSFHFVKIWWIWKQKCLTYLATSSLSTLTTQYGSLEPDLETRNKNKSLEIIFQLTMSTKYLLSPLVFPFKYVPPMGFQNKNREICNAYMCH